MIKQSDVAKILESYDTRDLAIGALGSHSALDICRGAKDLGFRTVVVCQEGREKTYNDYYRTEGELGVVDDAIILKRFDEIMKPGVIATLQGLNTVFLPHRSFEVYVGFDNIENRFRVPLFGSRSMLRAEERDEKKNQYYLMEKAGIPHPKKFRRPSDIDRLAIVKVPEARRSYERAFFLAASEREYREKSAMLLKSKMINQAGLKGAVVEEFVVGAQVNFNYFYSPVHDRLELLGTDMRRQTNMDGILRLPAPQQVEVLKYIEPRAIEAGHVACTVKESLLEQIFELGERFVRVSQREFPPGIIGPFALQAAFKPGPPKEEAVVFDISMRVQGSPGTKFTPYSEYLHGQPVSVGKRIAMEIRDAADAGQLGRVLT